MKTTFAFVPAIALLSPVWAQSKPIGDLVPTTGNKDSTHAPPAPLDETYKINVGFADLDFYSAEGTDSPKDTFAFLLNTTSSKIDKKDQLIDIDVSGLRTRGGGATTLGVRACDYQLRTCNPVTADGSTTKTFDKDALKSSGVATLKVSDFGTEGSFFYVFLQVEQKPGQDNPNYQDSPSVAEQQGRILWSGGDTSTAVSFSLKGSQ